MTRISTIEYAVASRRLSAAAASLAGYYRRELKTINGAIGIAREHLAGDISPADRVETSASLSELQRQLSDLDGGWDRSSLRRRILERAQPVEAIERRVSLAAAGGPDLASSARVTTQRTATTIAGYGIVYNRLSQNLGGFVERIEPGACTEALRASDIRCLYNHDSNYLLARSAAATLELREDSAGVYFTAHLLPYDPISYAISRRISRLDLSGCSFSFSGVTDRWILRPGATDLRVISAIGSIWDVGPVVYPAYPQTSCTATFAKAERTATPAAEYDLSDDGDDDQPVDLPRAARARDIPHEPSAAERALSALTDLRRFEAAEDADLARTYALESLERRLGLPLLSPARQREVGRQYRKAGRIIDRCKKHSTYY